MVKNKILCSLVFLLVFSFGYERMANASSNQVSVKLQNYLGNKSEVSIAIKGKYYLEGNSNFVLAEGNQYKVKLENNKLILLKNGSEWKTFTDFSLKPVKYGTGNYISINGNSYLGDMKFTIEKSLYIRPVNTLPLEDYLKGVVPHEMPAGWHPEALKAQALAARTYALNNINNVLVDTTSNQVYSGYKWNSSLYNNSNKAVNETKGQVLKYNNKLISTLFSSSNGGMVLSNTNTYGTDLYPYFKMKKDPYDASSSNTNKTWTYSLHITQIDMEDKDLTDPGVWWNTVKENDTAIINNMKKWLTSWKDSRNQLYIDPKYDIKIIAVPELTFKTSFKENERIDGKITLEYYLKDKSDNTFIMQDDEIKKFVLTINRRSYDIRSMFGTTVMKSPYITKVELKNDSFVVTGGGWGHGIGMSQYGAKKMAEDKFKYRDIVDFYYPGTKIDNYYNSAVVNLKGIDRYDTSAAISNYGWNQSNVVVIGRGDIPVDALSGSVLAKKYNAPLLLTLSDSIPASVESKLDTLKPSKVYVLGGTNAISDSVLNKIKNKPYINSNNVIRLRGATRHDTAIKIASEVASYSKIIITTDNANSPDALSIAPYAGVNQIPVLYTGSKSLNKSVENFIKDKGVKNVILIGGTGAVSKNVESRVKTLVGTNNVTRVDGVDRYETSVNIVKTFNLDNRKLFFSRGEVFIDSLAGSALSAKLNAPIILVGKDSLPTSVKNFIDSEISFIPEVFFLGGDSAISSKTRDQVRNTIIN